MTCAHVVNQALGRPWDSADRPERSNEVVVDFPFSARSKERFTGHVVEWFPPQEAPAADIAVIEISGEAHVQALRPTREPVFPGQDFWTIGFPFGQDGGMDARGQIGRLAEHDRLIAHGDQLPGFFIEGGYSGAPIVDRQSAVLIGMAAMAVREKEKRTAFILPIQDIERAWPLLARPYQGLSAFRESDARFFKGRDRYVRALAEKLDKIPLVAVVGPSGSGKSSLVRAGLLPQLRARQDWKVIVFRPASPTSNPFANLVVALDDRVLNAPLVELLAREEKEVKVVAASLLDNPKEFGSILRRLASSDGRPLLLVSDQFEELFTAVADPFEHDIERSVRAKFVRALAAGLRAEPSCRCVLTIRADYMGRVLEIPDLASLLQDADVKLGPMTPGELREAITQPGAILGVDIDDALVSELLVEVGGTPDALPLLEFALTELWSQQQERQIRRSIPSDGSQDDAAGIQAPLIRHAESVFADMVRECGETTFRSVMVGLVWIADKEAGGQDTRRPRSKDSFDGAEWNIVEQLASEQREARLVTMRGDHRDGEITAEIAHEVLIRQWPRLQRWLDEDRAFRLWLQSAERDAKEWRKAADKDLLYRGGRLQEALRWQRERAASDLSVVSDFLHAAEQQHHVETDARKRAEEEHLLALTERAEAEERARVEAERRAAQERAAAKEATRLQAETNVALKQVEQEKAAADRALRRSRIALGSAIFAFVFAVLAAFYALLQWEQGKRLERLAVANESRALSALSRVELSRHHMADALKLGLAAWPRKATDRRPRLETTLATISEVISTEQIPLREFIHESRIRGARLIRGERLILSWSDNKLRLWDVETERQIGAVMQHDDDVNGAVMSKDERRILSWSSDKTLRLWDAATGQQIGPAMQHDNPVWGGQLSKDELRILSWSSDKTLRLWDAATGRQIGPAMRHGERVWGAQLSKDEGQILSWSFDNTIRLWDTATGQQIGPAMRHDNWVLGVQLSEDERRILSWSSDKTLRLWDAATGQQIGPAMRHEGLVWGARLTKDEQRILSWSSDKSLRLWDAATGQQIGLAMRHDGSVSGARPSKDERRILSWSDDKTVRLWDTATGLQIGPAMQHDGPVVGARLTKDEQRILSWSSDKTLRLWDAVTGQQIGPAMRHKDRISGTQVNETEDRVLSWSFDNSLQLWDMSTGRQVGSAIPLDGRVLGAQLSKDGRLILSRSSDKTMRLWDTATRHQIGPAMQHNGDIYGARLFQDEQRILSWSDDKTLRLWDAATGQQIGPAMQHDDRVLGTQLSKDERRILSWSSDKTLRLWDAATGHQIGPAMWHSGPIWAAQLSKDERRILSWSQDKTVRLWDAATGQQIGAAMQHDDIVWGAQLSKDERRILSWSQDKTVRLWDAATGHQIGPTIRHDGTVRGAQLSNDEQRILSWSEDRTLRLWNAATGQQIGPTMQHDGPIYSAQFSKDERRILSRSSDKTLRLWDAATGQQIGPAMRHDAEINGAQLSKDERRILSWSLDKTLRLWDVATGQQIGPSMQHNDVVYGAQLSNDERRVLSWSSDKTLRLWNIAWPEGNILEVACALIHDRDLSRVSRSFGIAISEPICQSKNDLAPIDWSVIERSSQ
ncbi:trypsin-like peptidase domain-containing protein [Bradyrhizobium sp. KB893862 SZCCT0404]|nr:trypsin-like peptidase domain-containing protein [Bradyrhizobium sp. KB893862 SZCCT0404]